ncbi:MAG: hypothetical protein GY838_07880 [bacterium]|nr:hypothetical protein [bacterium]
MKRNLIHALLAMSLLVLVWGCGDDDDPTETANKLTGTFSINDGNPQTDSRAVTLLYDVAEADSARFCNVGSAWTTWLPIPVVKASRAWALEGDDGVKTVQAEFKSTDGRTLDLEDDIELDTVRTRILILDDNGYEIDLDIATLLEILPLTYDGDYCDDGGGVCPETYTRMIDHPITEGLPATFVTPNDWTYSFLAVHDASLATGIQVLFEGSNSGAALGIGTYGSGSTVHWSMAGEYDGDAIWSAETERILTNIAAFAD